MSAKIVYSQEKCKNSKKNNFLEKITKKWINF